MEKTSNCGVAAWSGPQLILRVLCSCSSPVSACSHQHPSPLPTTQGSSLGPCRQLPSLAQVHVCHPDESQGVSCFSCFSPFAAEQVPGGTSLLVGRWAGTPHCVHHPLSSLHPLCAFHTAGSGWPPQHLGNGFLRLVWVDCR